MGDKNKKTKEELKNRGIYPTEKQGEGFIKIDDLNETQLQEVKKWIDKFIEKDAENGYYNVSVSDSNSIKYIEVKFEGGKSPPQGKIQLMSKFSPVPFAEELMKQNKFVYDSRKQFWRYDPSEGIWRDDAEQFIRTELRRNLMGDEQQKKFYTDEVIHYIKDMKYNSKFELRTKPEIIAFKNKVFDLKKDKFVNFEPEHYITNKIPIEIDENKTECPEIDKFFEESLNKELKTTLYEIPAYCLYKGYPYQKIFFIYGAPSTGKSVYLYLLENFLGKENCSSVEPRQIQSDKHAMFKMWNKMANIVSDIDYNEFDNVNQVKKVTGGDSVNIRKMYHEGFQDYIFAKQIYSTNKLPTVKEKTMAWYRRIYPLEFNKVIPDNKKDRFLKERLVEYEQLQGFAYQCLQSLRFLYKNNMVFSYDINENKIPEVYEKLSNPIKMFIDENCKEGLDNYVYKYDFSERLNNWLKSRNFPPMTKTQVNQYMKEIYSESNRSAPDWAQGDFKDKYYRVWVGLRWKKSSDNLNNSSNLNGFNGFNGDNKKVHIYRKSFESPLKPLNPLSKEKEGQKYYIFKIVQDISRFALPEDLKNKINGDIIEFDENYRDLLNTLENEGYIILLGEF